MKIALVGCCKPKLQKPAPARELYLSRLFTLSLKLAERDHDHAYVVSAEYGLVDLDRVISPYDKRMSDIGKEWKAVWGSQIWSSIMERHPKAPRAITFLCGADYADPIRAAGHRAPAIDTFAYPMARMQIGQRLSFLQGELQ